MSWLDVVVVCLVYGLIVQGAEEPACRSQATQRCVSNGSGNGEFNFIVDGNLVVIDYSGNFTLYCYNNITLENDALPTFASTVSVNKVTFKGCPVPEGAYERVLDSLNVRLLDHLVLEAAAGAQASRQLSRAHLAGLSSLRALALVRLSLAPDVYEATPGLLHLRVQESAPLQLERLPASLYALHLVNARAARLHRDQLAHLAALRVLTVRDDDTPLSAEPPAAVRQLSLEAPAVRLDTALVPDSLVELTVRNWHERAPRRLASCAALRSVDVVNATARSLPAAWLWACPELREVRLQHAPHLAELAPRALSSRTLQRLTLVTNGKLDLPVGLLDDTTRLKFLKLSNNKLENLPDGLFAKTREIEELHLDYNNLTADALDSVQYCKSLRVLQLSYNLRLGDACGGKGSLMPGLSKFKELYKLVELRLRATGASLVCRDWRLDYMPRLEELDLRDNRITRLTYDDTQFESQDESDVQLTVSLRGNNVTTLLYSRDDYRHVVAACAARRPPRVRLDLPPHTMRCDCHALWAARAHADCPAERERFGDATCAGRPVGDLVCPQPAAHCPGLPPACDCASRDDDTRPRDPRAAVWRVTCRNESRVPHVPHVPHVPALAQPAHVAWHLALRHNRISELRAADMPRPLRELDVRDNNLKYIPAEVVNALPDGSTLLAAGNPLSCACEYAEHVAALVARHDLRTDGPTCAGAPLAVRPACRLEAAGLAPSGPLGAAGPAPSGPLGAAGLAALVLAPLAVALALASLCAASPRMRRGLQRVARKVVCGVEEKPEPEREPEPEPEPGPEREPEAALFDVFVSYSHHDAAVAARVVQWLEQHQYRVCEHSRDWAPGGWIPAQIDASVRRSRRTLLLVSPHYLRSAWALAEFRQAHAAARLVAVLLAAPAALPLRHAPALRRYLRHNTYVLWGDAHLWAKLRAALPPPARPAPAALAAL